MPLFLDGGEFVGGRLDGRDVRRVLLGGDLVWPPETTQPPTPPPSGLLIEPTGNQSPRSVAPFAVALPGQRLGVYFETGTIDRRHQLAGSSPVFGSGSDNPLIDALGSPGAASDVGRWRINGQTVDGLARKTTVADSVRVDPRYGSGTHFVYGTWVTLDAPAGIDLESSVTIDFDHAGWSPITGPIDRTVVHPAIHCSQSGFHPDEGKRAYVSWWSGLAPGGATESLDFLALPWRLRRVSDGAVVANDVLALELAKTVGFQEGFSENYNDADIFFADFSAVADPGQYVFELDGYGRSYPFTIAADQIERHLRYHFAGWYNARAGIEKKVEFGGWSAPANQPEGTLFHKTSLQILHTSEGAIEAPNAIFRNHPTEGLAAKATGETTTAGWGGHHDAGDWDRRWTALIAPINAGLLVDAFPALRTLDLTIPESGEPPPDIISEMMWTVDFFGRLQEPSGGVGGGADTDNYATWGTASWTEARPYYLYAPDPVTSAMYAMAAIVCSNVIEGDAARVASLRAKAISAFDWAVANATNVDSRVRSGSPWTLLRGALAGAAVALYWVTRDARFHTAFQTWTDLASGDHYSRVKIETCYIYARCQTDNLSVDNVLVNRCHERIDYDAGDGLGQLLGCGGTKNIWAPTNWSLSGLGFSFLSALVYKAALDPTTAAQAVEILSRHRHRQLGANPANLCFVAGMGSTIVNNTLWVDTAVRGENPPPGVCPFGEYNGYHHSFDHFTREWPNRTDAFPPPAESFANYFDAVPLAEPVADYWANMVAPLCFLYAQFGGGGGGEPAPNPGPGPVESEYAALLAKPTVAAMPMESPAVIDEFIVDPTAYQRDWTADFAISNNKLRIFNRDMSGASDGDSLRQQMPAGGWAFSSAVQSWLSTNGVDVQEAVSWPTNPATTPCNAAMQALFNRIEAGDFGSNRVYYNFPPEVHFDDSTGDRSFTNGYIHDLVGVSDATFIGSPTWFTTDTVPNHDDRFAWSHIFVLKSCNRVRLVNMGVDNQGGLASVGNAKDVEGAGLVRMRGGDGGGFYGVATRYAFNPIQLDSLSTRDYSTTPCANIFCTVRAERCQHGVAYAACGASTVNLWADGRTQKFMQRPIWCGSRSYDMRIFAYVRNVENGQTFLNFSTNFVRSVDIQRGEIALDVVAPNTAGGVRLRLNNIQGAWPVAVIRDLKFSGRISGPSTGICFELSDGPNALQSRPNASPLPPRVEIMNILFEDLELDVGQEGFADDYGIPDSQSNIGPERFPSNLEMGDLYFHRVTITGGNLGGRLQALNHDVVFDGVTAPNQIEIANNKSDVEILVKESSISGGVNITSGPGHVVNQ